MSTRPEIAGKECRLAAVVEMAVLLVSDFMESPKRVAASVDTQLNVAARVDDGELEMHLSIGFVLVWKRVDHRDPVPRSEHLALRAPVAVHNATAIHRSRRRDRVGLPSVPLSCGSGRGQC
jgi:hypothetical protein